MADLPSVKSKINDLEVNSGRPVSELTQQRIGSNINYLIDRFEAGPETGFLSAGSFSYVTPDNVFVVAILAAGGGGGGGAGIDGTDHGGQGGSGAVPIYQLVKVTPGVTYNIIIGQGGSGGQSDGANGLAGSPTIFDGPGARYVWPGALGGSSGNYASGAIYGLDLNVFNDSYVQGSGEIGTYTPGGWGTILTGSTPSGGAVTMQNGVDSPFASGGLTPSGVSADDTGGGGGAGFQSGGRGSNSAGSNTSGGISAGGGGGFVNGFPGASGGNGMMIIKPIL